jgi:hypothetical protein
MRDRADFKRIGFGRIIRLCDPRDRQRPSPSCKSRRSHRESRCRAQTRRGGRAARCCLSQPHGCETRSRQAICRPCQACPPGRPVGAPWPVLVAGRRCGRCRRSRRPRNGCDRCIMGWRTARARILLVLYRLQPHQGVLGRLPTVAEAASTAAEASDVSCIGQTPVAYTCGGE